MSRRGGVLITSAATIAVCASLVVGSTYALFTSEEQVDISVTAGNVAVTATIANQKVLTPASIDYVTGAVAKDTEYKVGEGVATFKDNLLAVSNVLPGDKVVYD